MSVFTLWPEVADEDTWMDLSSEQSPFEDPSTPSTLCKHWLFGSLAYLKGRTRGG